MSGGMVGCGRGTRGVVAGGLWHQDEREGSRGFGRWNQSVRHSPNSNRLCSDCRRLFPSIVSRMLFLAEFLETRIVPKRIEHRIEPKQLRSERHVRSQRTLARYREQFL